MAGYAARLTLLRVLLERAVGSAMAARRTGSTLQAVHHVLQRLSHAWEEARAAEERAAAEREELFKQKSSEQAEEVRPAESP